jgi:predicted DNA-binding transcriptional regulator AlpA
MHGSRMLCMEATSNSTNKIRRPVRLRQLARRLGYSETTLWRWEQAGKMPKRHSLVPGGLPIWWEDEIEAWQKSDAAHEAA